MIKEIAANKWIIDKYMDDHDHVLYYCDEDGPFALKKGKDTGVCPVCKKKALTYNQITNTIKILNP